MQNVINKGTILNLSSNPDVYLRGERYFNEGKVRSVVPHAESEGHTIVRGVVAGNYKDYEVVAHFGGSGALKHYGCNCEAHSIWRGACKHVVAVLLYCAQHMPNASLPGQMRRHTRNLTDALEQCIFSEIDSQLQLPQADAGKQARLVPTLHVQTRPAELYVTLRVGYDRLYVVKNISVFLAAVRNGENLSYGKNLSFIHAPEAFDDEDRPFLAMLLQEDALMSEVLQRVNRYYYSSRTLSDARNFTLTARSMDAFFALYEGKEVPVDRDAVPRGADARFVSGLPPVALRIAHQPDETRLSVGLCNGDLLKGQQYHYLMTEDKLYRMSLGDGQIVSHVLLSAGNAPDRELVFTDAEQRRFLSVVLPRLTRMGLVTDIQGEVPELTVCELRVKLYFDTEGKDISGRVEYIYADDPPAVRDMVGEYAVKRRLSALGFTYNEKKGVYILSGNDAVYHFLQGGLDGLREGAEVFVSDALQQKNIQAKAPTVGLRLEGNLLTMNVTDAGYTVAELIDALDAYRARKKYHRLKDGRFLSMEGEGVARMAALVDALDITRKEARGGTVKLPAYRALYVNEMTKDLDAARSQGFENLVRDFQRPPDFAAPLPDVLREYQKAGYRWLKTLAHYGFGGILADDMGLGKTLQIIALMLNDQAPDIHSLVVAPTSLLYNWESEIKRFAPALTTRVVTGTAEKRRELLQDITGVDVLITTYDTMKRDTAEYERIQFEYVVADEAQNIKNAATQNAKAIKEINGRVKYALTGTPIENGLSELWSIFDFIMPGYLYSHHKFSRLYEYPIMKDGDDAQAARLRQQIAPFLLRRLKRSVLTELPEKTETMLQAEMTAEQKKIYQAHLLKARGELETIAESRIAVLAQLTRLRQICCHPSLFLEGYNSGSGKLALAMETIQMAVESGHRLLLFSQFTSMLDILRDALAATPYAFFYLDGATKAADRMEMTRRFNGGERDVFLISLKAGGTGLNLTGADVVVHYDPWWNPSVMDQASDRAHRFGQEKAVQIFNLVAKDSVEEKIMELQQKKRSLIDTVIAEGGSMINALTEDELRELFA